MIVARGVLAGALATAAMALIGCGEKTQTMTGGSKKADGEPWSTSNSANTAYNAPGWKASDRASWEEQLRQRNQAQNDYVR